MGGGGKVSPIGWAHLYLSANFHNMFSMSIGKGKVQGRVREEVRADFMTFYGARATPSLILHHFTADFNSQRELRIWALESCRGTLFIPGRINH